MSKVVGTSSRTDMLRPWNTACRWLYLLYCFWQCLHTFVMFLLNLTFGTFFPLDFTSKCRLNVNTVCNFFHDASTKISRKQSSVSWVREGDFLALQKDEVAPKRQTGFLIISQANQRRPRFLKHWSAKVPALKDLLDRPLDLGTMELVDQAMRTAGVVQVNWTLPLANWLRSLKRHGSSPERVLDLLCFLAESSDEKMQKMDLDDVTVEHLTAARSALREVIGDAELAVKKGKKWWNWGQNSPWLGCWPWVLCLGSEALPKLQAMDARASILMTRLGQKEAQKENDAAACLQEVA